MSVTTISLPLSKSIAIRKLIVHFIRYGRVLPLPGVQCSDIQTVQTMLHLLLAERKMSLTILDAHDCGAAYRFITAIAAATPGEWLVTGQPRLLQRPIQPLVDALLSAGADIQQHPNGLLIHGKWLNASELRVNCSQSSQFGSALQLAAPLLGNPKISTYPDQMPSQGYYRMTLAITQEPAASDSTFIENDWSAALYWYAYALLHPDDKLSLKGLNKNSLQPDAVIAEWFEKWGVHTDFTAEGASLTSNGKGIFGAQCLDLSNNIDCAPILAVTALLYPFELTLCGIGNLNKKESPRKDIIIKTLSQFTEIANISNESFTIRRRQESLPEQLMLSSHNDHRFVLAWTLFKAFTRVTIDDEGCVSKSYPGFSGTLNG